MSEFSWIEHEIEQTMLADRHRLRQQFLALTKARQKKESPEALKNKLLDAIAPSKTRFEARRLSLPKPIYDETLPIHARRDEIAEAIKNNQVVIVSGETGSGKSTQLPKICLSLGRGVSGLIGHTQPRRIAARSIATRLADELQTSLGREVGFKVRFSDSTGPQTFVKLMTDGILLAETQNDRFLTQYDTIILDEAHERSLNIDFLIGYIKRILPSRPELKLIITSATIDAARFAAHFPTGGKPAPVMEVSGRTYPVELRYRPLVADENGEEPEPEDAVVDAVKELSRIDTGDILIFMPTERDIHEIVRVLRGTMLHGDSTAQRTEIIPLYARLPTAQQQKVFQAHPHRRIVIATNVAESSLTVPGIRYVIDTGTARISRYSARSKTQRLPIEAVSQASADQRAGRCGRLGPGVCIRLYSEEDYLSRDRYTQPEILRSNLASVILQTKSLRLGDVEKFPFLEPPKSGTIRDGYDTLYELGALDDENELTERGRTLARLPVDPRIGRMILAAVEENCLNEVLIIASALEVRDPRERPIENAAKADVAHAPFREGDSDFLGYLKLWDFYHELRKRLSRNQLTKACKQNFLSAMRMREWADVHLQLKQLIEEVGWKLSPRKDDADAVHRAILAGLLSSIGRMGENFQYDVTGGGKAFLWPGSALFQKRPKWAVAAETVETTKRYLRTAARIDPRWIEPLAAHLLKHTFSDPYWDGERGCVMALERVSLFGLTIIPQRRTAFGAIDPVFSRELFIRYGLVEEDIANPPPFLKHNHEVVEQVKTLEAKLRRNDLLREDDALYEFYDRRLPEDVYDVGRLNRWRKEVEKTNPLALFVAENDLLVEAVDPDVPQLYPDAIPVGRSELALEYKCEPGAEDDGVTLEVPLAAIGEIDERRMEWLVPGLIEAKVSSLIKSLPKDIRRQLHPVAETARAAAKKIRFAGGDFFEMAAAELSRAAGCAISPRDFQTEKISPELRMHLRILDDDGKMLAQGRDLEKIKADLHSELKDRFAKIEHTQYTKEGITQWDFGELPAVVHIKSGGMDVTGYPALVDAGEKCALRLAESPERAERLTQGGLRRMVTLAAWRDLKSQIAWLPEFSKMQLHAASLKPFDMQKQIGELIAERAFLAGASIPRTPEQFAAFMKRGKLRIAGAVQEIAPVLPRLFENYHQAKLELEKTKSSLWQYALNDMRRQLHLLTGPTFLTATPWEWLVHVPRYFRGIIVRLDRLRSGGLGRDKKAFEDELAPRLEKYEAARNGAGSEEELSAEWRQYRWLLEEYRISLFAQNLGTSLSISGKRLDKVLSG